MQTCRWEFLVFSGTFDTALTVEEDHAAGRVVFNLVSSSFMRSFQGAWQVSAHALPLSCTDAAPGNTASLRRHLLPHLEAPRRHDKHCKPSPLLMLRICMHALQVHALPGGGCTIEHRLAVQPLLAPPDALAGYTQRIFVRQVEVLLEDLRQELCRPGYH